MDADEARSFIRSNHRCVLATTRRDGGVQMSLVAAAVDDGGHVVISTQETAAKTANVRRNPKAYVCVFTNNFFGPWVQAEGTVTIQPLPEAMDGLVAYYRSVSGEHPDWDEYRRAMVEERRVLLHLTIERAGPTTHG
ncbi:MAG: PPOX class F420-dependent oxidoreductase [Chloroflexota bacterium]|nr:MAG: PPOX class F420-dependent oxidoreductase [Chloroflexota bacterium]